MDKLICHCGCGKEIDIINKSKNTIRNYKYKGFPRYIKNHSFWKGKHFPLDMVKKMAKGHIGIKVSKESIIKRNNTIISRYGKFISHTKGMKIHSDKHKNELREKMIIDNPAKRIESRIKISISKKGKSLIHSGSFKKGHKVWNEGLTKENNETLKNLSEYLHEKFKGKKPHQNTIDAVKKHRSTQIFPKKDSKPEVKIQNFLKQLNIEFFTHQYMHIEHGYQCDIFIPSMKMIIECDGDYWHGNPIIFSELTERQKLQKQKDELRTKELQDKGYIVLRLWERDIKVLNKEGLNQLIIKGGKL